MEINLHGQVFTSEMPDKTKDQEEKTKKMANKTLGEVLQADDRHVIHIQIPPDSFYGKEYILFMINQEWPCDWL